MTTPGEILGVDEETLFIERSEEFLQAIRVDLERPESDLCMLASLQHSQNEQLCLAHYLLGEWDNARRWIVQLSEASEFLFFGDWPERQRTDDGIIDPRWWWYGNHRAVNWSIEFSVSISWLAAADLWDQIDRLMEFPVPELQPDLEGKLIARYYQALARWWNHDMDETGLLQIRQMRGSGSRDVHSLCEILQMISHRDASGLSRIFATYLKRWEQTKKDCPQCLAMEASFLWNVARRFGVEFDLPNELKQQLIIFPNRAVILVPSDLPP